MMKFWEKRLSNSVATENLEPEKEIARMRKELRSLIARKFAGSLAIRMVDSGSCNACEAECNALSNPFYDLERLGIHFVASPRHTDLMLLSGVVTANMYHHVVDAYHQMPKPAFVVTLGDCPVMQAPFEANFAIVGDAANLPVAYHIPGCPPDPDTIIAGLLAFLRTL